MYNVPIDWKMLVLNLRAHYKPMAQIAKEIGVNQSVIQHIARGECEDPKFSLGLILLNMHLKHCPEKHNALWVK